MLSNFSFIVADKLAGSGHLGWGRQLECNARELAEVHGITRVVSLTEDPIDAEVLEREGIGWQHFPVEDMSTPDLEEAHGLVDAIREEIDAAGRVVVHCLGGYGRTGTILACCLVADGMGAAQAIQTVRRLRGGSIETSGQERFVHTFEESRRARDGA